LQTKRGKMKTKKDSYCGKELSMKLKSFAHPIRIKILRLLKDEPNLNVTSIYKKLKLEQAIASHHLILLNRSGLLIRKRVGRENYYSINTQAFEEMLNEIRDCVLKN